MNMAVVSPEKTYFSSRSMRLFGLPDISYRQSQQSFISNCHIGFFKRIGTGQAIPFRTSNP
jgi:hypothetical protein